MLYTRTQAANQREKWDKDIVFCVTHQLRFGPLSSLRATDPAANKQQTCGIWTNARKRDEGKKG
jgi:hypothetical protein